MFDWDDLRYFLAVARHGTMSAAARALKVAQPTVGRRIAAFEKRLGSRLFLRAPAGFTLSNAGRSILAHAERMEEEALSAEILAAGRDAGLDGQVRVTASEWIITSVLGPALAPFLSRHSALSIELVADAQHMNLARRDADVAIRPSKFQHQDIFQREIASVEFGLYASDAYLARYGMPNFAGGCAGHVLVGMTEDMRTIVDVDWLPALVGKARVAVRTNGREPMATMAAAGIGIACLPRLVGDATKGLRPLATPTPGPRRLLWVGAHRGTRTVPRVKATLAFIVAVFHRLRPALQPNASPSGGSSP